MKKKIMPIASGKDPGKQMNSNVFKFFLWNLPFFRSRNEDMLQERHEVVAISIRGKN